MDVKLAVQQFVAQIVNLPYFKIKTGVVALTSAPS
jgi:hypothetical protein